MSSSPWCASVAANAAVYIKACREGETRVMYCDTHDPPLVTTGRGNLLAKVEDALKLPWVYKKTGAAAGPEAVAHEWQATKDAGPAHSNYALTWWEARAILQLADGALEQLFAETLASFGAALAQGYPGLAQQRADTQLAMIGMVWGIGPGRMIHEWRKFRQAYLVEDYLSMTRECGINNKWHDLHDATCLRNAQWAHAQGVSPDQLLWPLVKDPPARGPRG